MSRFYVGQRVRVARCENPTLMYLVGKEAVITEPSFTHSDGWRLRVDGVGERHSNGKKIAFLSDHLEPVQPEGWQPVEWSECLWQPEGLAA